MLDDCVIKVRGLCKSFGSEVVLQDVSFDVHRGETVAVIGPSGSGKSTMLRCIMGLERADGGTILIDGEPLISDGRYVPEATARSVCSRMGMVFQNFNLFPHMNVMQNLICAPTLVKGMARSEACERARARLAEVGLSDKESAMPSSLSGGQKQRVAIARALMMEPEVLSVMRKLSDEHMTMVVVTHEMGFAREASDSVLFMCDREIIANGPTGDIFENPGDPRIREFINSIL